jgi:chromosome partitioning protein
MAKVISFSIFKGGTGKTTSAVNTAAALTELGKQVLLVDLDQQASSTRYVGIDPDSINPSFYHVFLKQTPASVVRRKTAFGFDILPSSSLMAAIEESLEAGEEIMLRDILKPLQDDYDYILVDTPPGKAALAFNGIVAADLLLVPASAERMAIDGVSDLINHVQAIIWHKFRQELVNQKSVSCLQCTKHRPTTLRVSSKPPARFIEAMSSTSLCQKPLSSHARLIKKCPLVN